MPKTCKDRQRIKLISDNIFKIISRSLQDKSLNSFKKSSHQGLQWLNSDQVTLVSRKNK